MAEIVNPTSAMSIAQIGSATVRKIQRSSGSLFYSNIPQVNVPQGAKIDRFVEVQRVADRVTTNKALNIGVRAGNGIVARLRDLKATIDFAQQSSMTSSSTELLIKKGMRFSLVNVQAQAEILIDRIDRLVGQAAFKGINLISSDSPSVRLQTTYYGGGIDIEPQPLDPKGLGLGNFQLLNVGGIHDALSRLNRALIFADQRLNNLQTLQRGVQGISYNQQLLAEVVGDFGSKILPLGTLVNLKV